MTHAYLSHAPGDAEAAAAIQAGFAQAGVAVRVGDLDAASGPTLSTAAQDGIANGFAFIAILSPHAYDSLRMRQEMEQAIARNMPILPIRLGDAPLPAWWAERIGGLRELWAPNGVALDVNALLFSVRRFFHQLCPVISMMNLKGGVGKTTLAAQVFAALQRKRHNRVLLVDLDPQHNLSQVFFRRSTQDTLIYMDASAISLFEPGGLQGQPSPTEDWSHVNMADLPPPPADQIARRLLGQGTDTERLDLICGQFDISKYAFLDERQYIDRARDNFFRAIDTLRRSYDLIVLDTNPSATFLTRCALAVSSRVLAPIQPDRFSLRGVRLLNELIARLVEMPGRPPISVVFNGVERASSTDFEQDLRSGALDPSVGFPVSRSLLKTRMHTSRYLAVREEGAEDDPLQHLAIYRAKGIWASALKDAINGIASELTDVLQLDARAPVSP